MHRHRALFTRDLPSADLVAEPRDQPRHAKGSPVDDPRTRRDVAAVTRRPRTARSTTEASGGHVPPTLPRVPLLDLPHEAQGWGAGLSVPANLDTDLPAGQWTEPLHGLATVVRHRDLGASLAERSSDDRGDRCSATLRRASDEQCQLLLLTASTTRHDAPCSATAARMAARSLRRRAADFPRFVPRRSRATPWMPQQ